MKYLKITVKVLIIFLIVFYYLIVLPGMIYMGKPMQYLSDSIEFSSDGKYIVATTSRFAYLWEVNNRELIKVIPFSTVWNSAAAISPDSSYLAGFGPDFTLYDIDEDREIYEIEKVKSYRFFRGLRPSLDKPDTYNPKISMGFSPDSRYIMLDYGYYFDIENLTYHKSENIPYYGSTLSYYGFTLKEAYTDEWGVLIFPENDTESLSIYSYDPIKNKKNKRFEVPNIDRLHLGNKAHTGGSKIFLLNENKIYVLDMIKDEKRIISLQDSNDNTYFCVSHNGDYIAVATSNDIITIYQTDTGSIINRIKLKSIIFGYPLHIRYLALHPDNKWLAIGYGHFLSSGVIYLLNIENNKLIRLL